MAILEVCANSIVSAIAAQTGGAARVELCDNLYQGGTTPSHGTIFTTRRALQLPIYVLIRPRCGDFLYNDLEFESMLADIKHCAEAGCDGIVTGVLNSDGSVDKKRNGLIIELCRRLGLGATFHRAFDMCADQPNAIEDIIELGFERVLTSGGKSSAMEGCGVIRHLIEQAGDRITIMPGGGINESNINDLLHFTGATEFHSSARSLVQSQMSCRNNHLMMDVEFIDEYTIYETDAARVRELVRLGYL